MSVLELFLLAVGLSMDAFAVAVCKGLAVKELKPKHSLICGAWFGSFQALMPLIGYLLFKAVQKYIESIDHWIAFVLLGFLGAKMIKEALSKCEECVEASFGFKAMLIMALATSIDALAAGITLTLPGENEALMVILAVLFIGVITFTLSAIGVKIGNVFGAKYKSKAELAGGIILVLIGVKILLEHLGIISF